MVREAGRGTSRERSEKREAQFGGCAAERCARVNRQSGNSLPFSRLPVRFQLTSSKGRGVGRETLRGTDVFLPTEGNGRVLCTRGKNMSGGARESADRSIPRPKRTLVLHRQGRVPGRGHEDLPVLRPERRNDRERRIGQRGRWNTDGHEVPHGTTPCPTRHGRLSYTAKALVLHGWFHFPTRRNASFPCMVQRESHKETQQTPSALQKRRNEL